MAEPLPSPSDSASPAASTLRVAEPRAAGKRNAGRGRRWRRLQAATTVGALALIFAGAHLDLGLGTFSVFGRGPIQIACPLGAAQVMAAARTLIPTLAVAGLAGVILTLLLGRAFCGWLCPGRWLYNRGPRTARQPWPARRWIQGGIVTGIIGLSWVCQTPVFCFMCPVGSICRGTVALGTGGSVLPALGWLSAWFGVEWLSGRSWCRDLCPVGALLSRISAWNPFIKVKANPEKCRPCLACMKKCPEAINLSQAPDLSGCTKCFACRGTCPREAVEIKFGRFR